jgi:phage-related protein
MGKKFEVILLEEVLDFIDSLDLKTRKKIYYNLDKAKSSNDPKFFKKLTDEIWEFRTKYNGLQHRLFAFWDKTDSSDTLVVSTHGMIKKVNKVPRNEIEKALKIRTDYFELKD